MASEKLSVKILQNYKQVSFTSLYEDINLQGLEFLELTH